MEERIYKKALQFGNQFYVRTVEQRLKWIKI